MKKRERILVLFIPMKNYLKKLNIVQIYIDQKAYLAEGKNFGYREGFGRYQQKVKKDQ